MMPQGRYKPRLHRLICSLSPDQSVVAYGALTFRTMPPWKQRRMERIGRRRPWDFRYPAPAYKIEVVH